VSVLQSLRTQAKSRRDGKPAFTLPGNTHHGCSLPDRCRRDTYRVVGQRSGGVALLRGALLSHRPRLA
jgi:hypothetical protein